MTMTTICADTADWIVLSFRPPIRNLVGVRAGDDTEMAITLTRAGVAVDLTDSTIEAQARAAPADPDPPALTADITVTDSEAGRFTVVWPGDQVRTVLGTAEKWQGYYDIQVDDTTVLAGTIGCEQDVTR
jgi:hypothetical protein